MKLNSEAGNLIPKLLCAMAVVSLVAFFLLNQKGEVPRNADSTTSANLSALQSGQTNKPNRTTTDKDTLDSRTGFQPVKCANIDAFPFSVSKPTPAEGTEEDSLHCYNVNVPLETGLIIDINLEEPEGADLALGIFTEDGMLAYSNNTRDGGTESIRFIITNEKSITVAVETVDMPQTSPSAQYTLSVTSDPEEKGYLIESLPFTASKPIKEQEKIHIYQTAFPVEDGTIVQAGLKAQEDAELALYISDENGTLNRSTRLVPTLSVGTSHEEEAALTFFKGGRATIIVEVKNKEGQPQVNGGGTGFQPVNVEQASSLLNYTLSVNTKGVERLIETLPYTASGYMSQSDAEGERWHWYQIASTVPAGTVISANLSVTGKANMDVTIFVDRDTISYGANHGIGGDEHAELTIEKDSKVYIIIDNVVVEQASSLLNGEGDYSLTVTSTIPTKL